MVKTKREDVKKAKAQTERKCSAKNQKKDNKSAPSKEGKQSRKKSDVPENENLLATMLLYHVLEEPRTFEQLSVACGCDTAAKSWVDTFEEAKERSYVEASGEGAYLLSESGVAEANKLRGDDPVKAATTDEDYHNNIKKVLKSKMGPEIFDALLKEEEALSNQEIADKFRMKEGSPKFFYSLKELKVLGLLGLHPDCKGRIKKWCVIGKSFLDGKQRKVELKEKPIKKKASETKGKKKTSKPNKRKTRLTANVNDSKDQNEEEQKKRTKRAASRKEENPEENDEGEDTKERKEEMTEKEEERAKPKKKGGKRKRVSGDKVGDEEEADENPKPKKSSKTAKAPGGGDKNEAMNEETKAEEDNEIMKAQKVEEASKDKDDAVEDEDKDKAVNDETKAEGGDEQMKVEKGETASKETKPQGEEEKEDVMDDQTKAEEGNDIIRVEKGEAPAKDKEDKDEEALEEAERAKQAAGFREAEDARVRRLRGDDDENGEVAADKPKEEVKQQPDKKVDEGEKGEDTMDVEEAASKDIDKAMKGEVSEESKEEKDVEVGTAEEEKAVAPGEEVGCSKKDGSDPVLSQEE